MPNAEPHAVIDIGSNSVRLVVYAGPERIPTPIFNEKVLAGLGTGLEQSRRLAAGPREKALKALSRFRLLVEHMRIKRTRVLATAAIRDAEDGPDFVQEVKRIGFDCEVVKAEQEAQLAGLGVLSGIPDADGIAGDLGGGSLELVDIGDGAARAGISTALGVLRATATAGGERDARRQIREALKRSGLSGAGRGREFYMVGGSWRALARIDMLATDYPLPITQQYSIAPERAKSLRRLVNDLDPRFAKVAAASRLASTPVAAMLLSLLVEELEPSALTFSTFGIREGLLYSQLKPKVRAIDPLTEEARHAGGGEHRFGQHGDILDQWIAPLFDDAPHMQRLRLTACLLADVAWQANPGFRAERAVEMALHGNWVAVTPPERVLIAHALAANFGEEKLPDPGLAQLCDPFELRQAKAWGAAMRLGQRLSGGVGSVLQRCRLSDDGETLRLHVRVADAAIVGDTVKRRLTRLAEVLGRTAEVSN